MPVYQDYVDHLRRTPPITLIAAMTRNRVIGQDNRLPWSLPGDLRYFRQQTLGKAVVMGRRTWESLPGPLVGRDCLILTRQADYSVSGAQVCTSPAQALALARQLHPLKEVMVIGGAQVYDQFLPSANRLLVTLVQGDVEGDAYFPSVDWTEWSLFGEEKHDTHYFQDWRRRVT